MFDDPSVRIVGEDLGNYARTRLLDWVASKDGTGESACCSFALFADRNYGEENFSSSPVADEYDERLFVKVRNEDETSLMQWTNRLMSTVLNGELVPGKEQH